jgi:hypothetical protein
MIDKDSKIFDDKSLSDVFRDIYNNSKDKQTKIDNIVNSAKDVIKDISSASLLLPIIKEILEISVKNDEQLVKLAAIIQKILDKKEIQGGLDIESILPIEEKRQLLLVGNNGGLTEEEIDDKIKQLSTMVEKAKKHIKEEEKKAVDLIRETDEKKN